MYVLRLRNVAHSPQGGHVAIGAGWPRDLQKTVGLSRNEKIRKTQVLCLLERVTTISQIPPQCVHLYGTVPFNG